MLHMKTFVVFGNNALQNFCTDHKTAEAGKFFYLKTFTYYNSYICMYHMSKLTSSIICCWSSPDNEQALTLRLSGFSPVLAYMCIT